MYPILNYDGHYLSTIFLKFINNWIFWRVKAKMEKLILVSFFLWKKAFFVLPILSMYEALVKIRPLVGFYLYFIKKKRKKIFKIIPYYMSIISRWRKAVYWLSLSIKSSFYTSILNRIFHEFYSINFFQKSKAINQKYKYYKLILLHKSSKHYKW